MNYFLFIGFVHLVSAILSAHIHLSRLHVECKFNCFKAQLRMAFQESKSFLRKTLFKLHRRWECQIILSFGEERPTIVIFYLQRRAKSQIISFSTEAHSAAPTSLHKRVSIAKGYSHKSLYWAQCTFCPSNYANVAHRSTFLVSQPENVHPHHRR